MPTMNILRAAIVLGIALTVQHSASASDSPKTTTKTTTNLKQPTVGTKAIPAGALKQPVHIKDLSLVKPLTTHNLITELAVQDIKITPEQLLTSVDLTPRRPWHDAKTYLRFTGGLSPGESPPRMTLRAGWYSGANFNGDYLRVHIGAAADTSYVVDCSVAGDAFSFTAALSGPGGHRVTGGNRNGHFVFVIPSEPTARDAFAHVYANGSWETSGCVVTPVR